MLQKTAIHSFFIVNKLLPLIEKFSSLLILQYELSGPGEREKFFAIAYFTYWGNETLNIQSRSCPYKPNTSENDNNHVSYCYTRMLVFFFFVQCALSVPFIFFYKIKFYGEEMQKAISYICNE